MPFRAAISAQPYACMCSRPFPTCHPNQAPQLAPVFFTAINSNPLTRSLSPRRSERAARAARRRSTLTNFAHRRCSNTTIPTQHPGEIFPPECLAGSARVIATTIFSPLCTPTFLQVAHAARRRELAGEIEVHIVCSSPEMCRTGRGSGTRTVCILYHIICLQSLSLPGNLRSILVHGTVLFPGPSTVLPTRNELPVPAPYIVCLLLCNGDI